MTDIDKELMREKDRLAIGASKVAIATGLVTIATVIVGIFVAMYVRPIEAKIVSHIAKNEPETEVLKMKVNALEIQYVEIIRKLDRIENIVKR